MALVPLLSGCRSLPVEDVPVSSKSSLLAVDVLFPFPLSRDPSLVQVFLVKGPVHSGLEQRPALIPATFVKKSRAYLLDPEPGTYSLVAVTSAVAPPRHADPVAGGVTQTVFSETIGNTVIFPAELIHRTRTTIAPGGAAFMGALRVQQGDRINANAVLQDHLQTRIAERIRPGVTSESGVAGWFTRTWTVDLEETSLSNEAADRESFFDAALMDLGDSPWAQVIARAAPREATTTRSRAPALRPKSRAPIPVAATPKPEAAGPEPEFATPKPEAVGPEPEFATPVPEAATREPGATAPDPGTATREPEASPPSPRRRRFPGLPPGSRLAAIELGMSHEEVRRILGDPDSRTNRLTAKAWIPFYNGPDAQRVEWTYEGEGRVVFSLYEGSLEVLDVVHDPGAGK